MTSAANTAPIAAPAARPKKDDGGWQWWGTLLVAPYLVVFVVFVLYPVGYGFWLGHNLESYVEIFQDPILLRAAVNTIVFLLVAVNLKMFVALLLSGFFAIPRWWIRLLGDRKSVV